MESKFYEQPSFKALQHQWNNKLVRSGFNDISKKSAYQSASKQHFSLASKNSFTESTVVKCSVILKLFNFESRKTKSPARDRFVFEQFTSGCSLRQIEKALRLKYPRRLRLRKSQVGKLITEVISEFDSMTKIKDSEAFKTLGAKIELQEPSLSAGVLKKHNYYLKQNNPFTEQYLTKCELMLKVMDFKKRRTKSARRDKFVLKSRLNGLSLRDIELALTRRYPERFHLSKSQIGKLLIDIQKEFDFQVKMIKACAA